MEHGRVRGAVALGVLLAVVGATAWAGEEVEQRAVPLSGMTLLTGKSLWTRQSVSLSSEVAVSTAVDTQGNVIALTGFEGDTLDMGSGPIPIMGSGGRFKAAVVKFAPDGTQLWGKAFGVEPGTGGANPAVDAQAVAVDWKGNISFLVLFSGTVDFGGGPLVGDSPGAAALVKLDRNGHHLWSRLMHIGVGGGFHVPLHIASDGPGNVAIVGGFEGTSDFGGGPVTALGTDPGSAFLAKFSASGTFEWVFLDNVYMGSEVNGVTADKDGNFLIAGGLRAFEGSRPFVYKLSPGGELLWTRVLAGAYGPANDVAVHANRVVVVGEFTGSFFFAGKRLIAGSPPGGIFDASDMFVLAFTADGEERWGRHFGRRGNQVAMDQDDGVVVLGTYESGDDLGLGPVTGLPDRDNPFVEKLDRVTGATRWVRTFPFDGFSPDELASAKTGESVLVGSFSLPVDLGTGTLVPHGPQDAFILKMAP